MQFALSTIYDGIATFAGTIYLSRSGLDLLRLEKDKAIYHLDDHLETIIEAYSFTDFETKSVFCKEGKTPYEAIIEQVYKNPLNDIRYILPTLRSVRTIWKSYAESESSVKSKL